MVLSQSHCTPTFRERSLVADLVIILSIFVAFITRPSMHSCYLLKLNKKMYSFSKTISKYSYIISVPVVDVVNISKLFNYRKQ